MTTSFAEPQSPWAKPVSREPNAAPWLNQVARIAARKAPDVGDPEILPPHLNAAFRRLRNPKSADQPRPTELQVGWLERSLAAAFADTAQGGSLPREVSWDPDGYFLLYWRFGDRYFDLTLNAESHDGELLVYNIDQAEEAWEHPINLGCQSCWSNLAEMADIGAAHE